MEEERGREEEGIQREGKREKRRDRGGGKRERGGGDRERKNISWLTLTEVIYEVGICVGTYVDMLCRSF